MQRTGRAFGLLVDVEPKGDPKIREGTLHPTA
jgi:hypothetical protein